MRLHYLIKRLILHQAFLRGFFWFAIGSYLMLHLHRADNAFIDLIAGPKNHQVPLWICIYFCTMRSFLAWFRPEIYADTFFRFYTINNPKNQQHKRICFLHVRYHLFATLIWVAAFFVFNIPSTPFIYAYLIGVWLLMIAQTSKPDIILYYPIHTHLLEWVDPSTGYPMTGYQYGEHD